jgi:iron(III) transport system substrate-binding protein
MAMDERELGNGVRSKAAWAMNACLLAGVAASLAAGVMGMAQAQPAIPLVEPAAWARVVAAAKKEGRVVLYSGLTISVTTRIAEGFKKAYPDIPIEFVRATSGALLARIEQEKASGVDGADVWFTSEVKWFIDRAKENALLKPAGPSVARWPGRYLREGAVAIIGIEPFTIVYNKTLVSNPPRGYADLLKPEFKGKLASTELAATANIAWYDWLEKTQGPEFLPKLKAQAPKLFNGATPIVQSVASGEAAIGVHAVPTATKVLTDQGAPLVTVVPDPGLGISYAMGLLGWSKRPNAAQVLADYVLSPAGQTVWHSSGESASPLTGIPGSLPISTIVPWDVDAYPPEVVAKYREHWNKIFK